MVKHTQKNRRLLLTNCLSVFDYLVGLALEGLVCDSNDLVQYLEKEIEQSNR